MRREGGRWRKGFLSRAVEGGSEISQRGDQERSRGERKGRKERRREREREPGRFTREKKKEKRGRTGFLSGFDF